ncbi:hypothetical protein D3C71_716820 [compost metagenome]
MTWDSLLFTKMVTNTGTNASGRSIKQAAMIARPHCGAVAALASGALLLAINFLLQFGDSLLELFGATKTFLGQLQRATQLGKGGDF